MTQHKTNEEKPATQKIDIIRKRFINEESNDC